MIAKEVKGGIFSSVVPARFRTSSIDIHSGVEQDDRNALPACCVCKGEDYVVYFVRHTEELCTIEILSRGGNSPNGSVDKEDISIIGISYSFSAGIRHAVRDALAYWAYQCCSGVEE